MAKADNIFVRAKAYVKAHPRTSFQDAIQKVKGKKSVSGVTRKKKAVISTAKKRVGFPMVAGVPKKRRRVPAATSRTRSTQTTAYSRGMAIIRKIESMEAKYKKAKTADEKKLLAILINAEHDKLDQVQKKRKTA